MVVQDIASALHFLHNKGELGCRALPRGGWGGMLPPRILLPRGWGGRDMTVSDPPGARRVRLSCITRLFVVRSLFLRFGRGSGPAAIFCPLPRRRQ